MSGGEERGEERGKERKEGRGVMMKGKKVGARSSRYETSSNVTSEHEFQSDKFGH
jgi:hypothetical protein